MRMQFMRQRLQRDIASIFSIWILNFPYRNCRIVRVRVVLGSSTTKHTPKRTNAVYRFRVQCARYISLCHLNYFEYLLCFVFSCDFILHFICVRPIKMTKWISLVNLLHLTRCEIDYIDFFRVLHMYPTDHVERAHVCAPCMYQTCFDLNRTILSLHFVYIYWSVQWLMRLDTQLSLTHIHGHDLCAYFSFASLFFLTISSHVLSSFAFLCPPTVSQAVSIINKIK